MSTQSLSLPPAVRFFPSCPAGPDIAAGWATSFWIASGVEDFGWYAHDATPTTMQRARLAMAPCLYAMDFSLERVTDDTFTTDGAVL